MVNRHLLKSIRNYVELLKFLGKVREKWLFRTFPKTTSNCAELLGIMQNYWIINIYGNIYTKILYVKGWKQLKRKVMSYGSKITQHVCASNRVGVHNILHPCSTLSVLFFLRNRVCYDVSIKQSNSTSNIKRLLVRCQALRE